MPVQQASVRHRLCHQLLQVSTCSPLLACSFVFCHEVACDSLKSEAAGNNTATPTSSPEKSTSSPEKSPEKPISIIESRPCSFGSPPPTPPRHPADANSARSPEVQNGVGWNQQHSPLPISPSTRAFWTRAGAPSTPSSPWGPCCKYCCSWWRCLLPCTPQSRYVAHGSGAFTARGWHSSFPWFNKCGASLRPHDKMGRASHVPA